MSELLFYVIVKIATVLIVFIVVMTMVPFLIWMERKVIADIQQRLGPNRVGPYGLLQPIADALKLILKEGIIPRQSDRWLYIFAPVISMVPAIALFAVIPFGTAFTLAGRQVQMVIADVDVGILYILAVSSLGVYGIVLAGWASGNKWSLLGGMRSSAQMLSYELPLGLSLVGPLILAGSLRLNDVVAMQGATLWFILPQTLAFVCFMISGIAETNRAPFDLPEAEQELTAGFHTEYTGFRFAMFFMGEYIAMVAISAVAVTFFLGGYRGFFPDVVWLQPIWLLLKIMALLYFFVWLRGTFPRLRYDQLMRIGWKALLPISLANTFVVALVLSIYPPRELAGIGLVPSSLSIWVLTAVSLAGSVILFFIGSWVLRRSIERRVAQVPVRRRVLYEDVVETEGLGPG